MDDPDEDIDHEIFCPTCDGSGEGARDGTSCMVCLGRGVPRDIEDEWPDVDEEDHGF